MAFAKFEGNRFRTDGEIAENHAILVDLTASRVTSIGLIHYIVYCKNNFRFVFLTMTMSAIFFQPIEKTGLTTVDVVHQGRKRQGYAHQTKYIPTHCIIAHTVYLSSFFPNHVYLIHSERFCFRVMILVI